jgi:uncharacterized 2Fe-2S/4Fe-4S cluster protein (DUF4445 family)
MDATAARLLLIPYLKKRYRCFKLGERTGNTDKKVKLMFKVKFLPDEKEVGVQGETTLMEAAQNAEVHINNLCGGKGVCGKCRVKVINGKTRADEHSISLPSKEEIVEGYVLACQAKVDADMEILIPAESRLEEGQILLSAVYG